MGRRFGLAASLAALMAFSQPAAAQEPLVARAIHQNVATRSIEDAAITVGLHSIGAAVYARTQGHDWKQAFVKTAGLRLGMEAAHLINAEMMSRGHPMTTATYVLGQVANSAQVNVMHARPMFSELEVNYLLASFHYANKEFSARPNLKPLLGAAIYAFSDASFSIERSIASGVFVFTYENPDDTSFNRLLFESRTSAREDEFRTMKGQGIFEGVIALHVPDQQLADIRAARDYLQEHALHSDLQFTAQRLHRSSATNARLSVDGTHAHEVAHQLNHDFAHKLISSQESVPWWVARDVSVLNRTFRLPVLKPALAATSLLFPKINIEERFLATTYRPQLTFPSNLSRKITLYGVPK